MKVYKYYDTGWGIGFWMIAVSSIVLSLCLLILPVNYYGVQSKIQECHSIKTTIAEARKSGISDIERAALTTKIVEVNQWITKQKYWNEKFFDIYIPDEIMELEP